MSKHDNTLVLAHYYTIPEVQTMADYVGDSLDLALKAVEEKPKRIVFAGVRFMAETAKILNPDAEVILPDYDATCSLVEQTDVDAMHEWFSRGRTFFHLEGKEVSHVTYINSSIRNKMLADVVVTSRIVNDVVADLHDKGHQVFFSPDRNMGTYLNSEFGYNMKVWGSVCEVHDKFKHEELRRSLMQWTDGPKIVLAHPESPLPVLKRADYVGSTHGMLEYVKKYPNPVGTFFVATEEGLLYNMRQLRPELVFKQAPTYSGCQCNQCPYMRRNTVELVERSIAGTAGVLIDYLKDHEIEAALKPLNRMFEYVK